MKYEYVDFYFDKYLNDWGKSSYSIQALKTITLGWIFYK